MRRPLVVALLAGFALLLAAPAASAHALLRSSDPPGGATLGKPPEKVTSPFDHTVLSSADGGAWTRQASTATPGSHQVSSTLPAPGYVIVAVPPAPPEQATPNRTPLFAGLAAAALLVAVAAFALARRLRVAPAEGGGGDDDYDGEDEDGDDPEGGPEADLDPGGEER